MKYLLLLVLASCSSTPKNPKQLCEQRLYEQLWVAEKREGNNAEATRLRELMHHRPRLSLSTSQTIPANASAKNK